MGPTRYVRGTQPENSVLDLIREQLNTAIQDLHDVVLAINTANGGTINISGAQLLAARVVQTNAKPSAPTYTLALSAGDTQTGTVGRPLSTSLAVVLTDSSGAEIPSATITWSTTDGSITAASVTNASGVATAAWTLGVNAGAQTATASAGAGIGTVTFTATGTADSAALIQALAGDGQNAPTSGTLPTAPAVLVTDQYGNGVSGVSVTFAVTAGGGSGTGLSQSTDADGVATVGSWTLGAAAGANTMTATSAGVSGSPVTFSATGVSTTPATLSIVSGDGQTGVTAGQAATLLTVSVEDSGGFGVQGVTVSWDVTAGGGSLSAATSVTDGAGEATVTLTTGTTVGSNTVDASITDPLLTVTFTVTTVAGAASQLVLVQQPASSGDSGVALPVQPIVEVRDANANAVLTAGTTITATVQTGTGTISAGSTAVTAATGRATFTGLTLTGAGSTNTLRFSDGTHTVDSDPVALTPPVPVAVRFVTQPGSVGVGAVLNPNPSVELIDGSGNRITAATNTVTVTLTVPGGATLGGTTSKAATAGVAAFTNLTVSAAGTYTLTATSGTLTSAQSGSFTISASQGAYNEPAGYSQVMSVDWSILPSTSAYDPAVGGLRLFAGAANVAIVTTTTAGIGTAPESPPNVLEMTWPASLGGGTGPFNMQAAGASWTALYSRMRLWVPANWTNNGNTGTKLWFFCQHSGYNHYVNFVNGASGAGTAFSVNLQGNGLNRNINGSFSLGAANRDQWLLVEHLLIPNTGANADGVARVWVNGTQVMNATNVQYFLSQHAHTFDQRRLNPTYGGGANHPPAGGLQVYLDHWYLSAP